MDEWSLLDLSYLVLSYDAAAGAGGSVIVTSSSAAAGSVLASSAGSIARGAGRRVVGED